MVNFAPPPPGTWVLLANNTYGTKDSSINWLYPCSRSQSPHGLRRRSAAVRLLGLLVQIPAEAWMFVYCECCVLSGRGLCVGLITRPEESYRVWCICDREASIMRRPWPTRGCRWKRAVSFMPRPLYHRQAPGSQWIIGWLGRTDGPAQAC
jgi:hypothetical protein